MSETQYLFSRENFQRYAQPIIIGVAGDSGSGKTRFSQGVKQLLGDGFVQTIEMDGYHKENRNQRRESGIMPLDPAANRFDELAKHLAAIKNGESISLPIYNHDTGDFDEPKTFSPSPIILLEGLHALYPEFSKYVDFSIYVDTSRQVKWLWKKNRDTQDRGHDVAALEAEMLKREALYKRYIDFQKTSATIVIKIFQSSLQHFARYEFAKPLDASSYKVELLIEPAQAPLPSLVLPLDLSLITDINTPPFLLASVASKYWGREIVNVHLDGELSIQTVRSLEEHIEHSTGVALPETHDPHLQSLDAMPTLRFAQLLIAWRFLEFVHQQFQLKHIV